MTETKGRKQTPGPETTATEAAATGATAVESEAPETVAAETRAAETRAAEIAVPGSAALGGALGGYRLDHIAVAVHDLARAVENYEHLGLALRAREMVPSEKAEVAFFDLGGARLELVASMRPDSAVARSLEKRGEGLHHIAIEVDDIDEALERARARGLPLINQVPVPGAGGTRVAFVHPKGLNGVLVELVEKSRRA